MKRTKMKKYKCESCKQLKEPYYIDIENGYFDTDKYYPYCEECFKQIQNRRLIVFNKLFFNKTDEADEFID